jgi:signal transduction histidine kinase
VVGPTWIDDVASTNTQRHCLRRLEIRSSLIVPLPLEQGAAGCVALATTQSRRRLGLRDQIEAEQLSRVAAAAWQNTRRYHAVHRELEAYREALAMVVHDLRTPLATVAFAADLLLEGAVPPDQASRYLHIIHRSASDTVDLVNDLMELARWEGGARPLRLEPLPVEVLIDDVLESRRLLAGRKQVRLRAHVPAGTAPVHADRRALVRALGNLLDNAIAASPQRERVDVTADRQGDAVVVSVSNIGPAIPAETASRLFEPFSRAEDSTGDGLGLGLAIARRIVEAHGGRIRVISSDGAPTTFAFTVPLTDTESAARPAAERRIR